MMIPMQANGPRCHDCGRAMDTRDGPDMMWTGEYWVCVEDEEGCAATRLARAVERERYRPRQIAPTDDHRYR